MMRSNALRRWRWLVPIFLAGFALIWWTLSRQPGSTTNVPEKGTTSQKGRAQLSKPICASVIVPAGTDCTPQHLAALPPDPGPAGMATLAGIDADNDGVRDDVQRYIATKYGHSERAVAALRLVARSAQQQVLAGDSITREEAKVIADTVVMKAVDCYSVSVAEDDQRKKALTLVVTEVTNTPERYARKRKFEALAANRVYMKTPATAAELCGYDPSKLSN